MLRTPAFRTESSSPWQIINALLRLAGLAETAKGVHKKDMQRLYWVDQMTSQSVAYFYA